MIRKKDNVIESESIEFFVHDKDINRISIFIERNKTFDNVDYLEGTWVHMYDGEGGIDRATLNGDQKIQDIWCMHHTKINYYRNGKIFSCTSSKSQTIDGIRVKRGDKLFFGLDGRLMPEYLEYICKQS